MSDQDHEPRAEKVGYGQPPTQTQFKPGKSGNPKGRPKGSKNSDTIIMEQFEGKIFVVENGHRRRISKREASYMQQANKAAAGDFQSFSFYDQRVRAIEARENGRTTALDRTEDEQVQRGIVERVRAYDQAAKAADAPNLIGEVSKTIISGGSVDGEL